MSRTLAAPVAFVAAALVGGGCNGAPTETGGPIGAGLDPAPIEMDASSYTLEAGDVGWAAELGFDFTNVTDRTISLLNCQGGYELRLEQWQEGEWVTAWAPVLLMCLSAPIEIAPGETHADGIRVFGGYPEGDTHPRFQVDPIEGTYRLVIGAAYWDYDHGGPPWGEQPPLEARISDAFQIRVADF